MFVFVEGQPIYWAKINVAYRHISNLTGGGGWHSGSHPNRLCRSRVGGPSVTHAVLHCCRPNCTELLSRQYSTRFWILVGNHNVWGYQHATLSPSSTWMGKFRQKLATIFYFRWKKITKIIFLPVKTCFTPLQQNGGTCASAHRTSTYPATEAGLVDTI